MKALPLYIMFYFIKVTRIRVDSFLKCIYIIVLKECCISYFLLAMTKRHAQNKL